MNKQTPTFPFTNNASEGHVNREYTDLCAMPPELNSGKVVLTKEG
jgi:hypothetical protein